MVGVIFSNDIVPIQSFNTKDQSSLTLQIMLKKEIAYYESVLSSLIEDFKLQINTLVQY
jgi:hypothetical protein